ncbi:MAG: excinuclease ABC subunit UvrA [Desulfobacterales bacterium]|nr:excinuclease ABC subunit UvrA [Desulfobacterales bacterium]
MSTDWIKIRGARQHNLKGIDLDLPRNQLVVITGLSGSGKSTLAFDTLYAEGQRRYVESLSAYARQFLERLAKPQVEWIEGLSPAIAIEQKTAARNPRSTVGTLTEIADYLRLLYARTGIAYCPECDLPIQAQNLDQFITGLLSLDEGTRLMIFASVARKAVDGRTRLLKRLRREGFARVRVDRDEIIDLEDQARLEKQTFQQLEVLVDRLIVRPKIRNRLADSLELAVSLTGGEALVETLDGMQMPFSESPVCPGCGCRQPELTPAGFSFNSPQGACPECDGLGQRETFAPELIVPNTGLSLREGAIKPWAHRHSVHFMEFLEALTAHYKTDVYTPYRDLPPAFKTVLMHGSGDETISFHFYDQERRQNHARVFEGLLPILQRRWKEAPDSRSRDELRAYMRSRSCTACAGSRLNPGARAVRVGAHTLPSFCALSAADALAYARNLKLEGHQGDIARKILAEVINRLAYIVDVGLPYISLDRSAASLSGGESQRIRLATQIGSKLTGVLYVLDEPSIGLHPRDNQRLLASLLKMRDLGNSVLVVEHDEETIRTADFVVDMGPGAGIKGGEVVFAGPPGELLKAPGSLTGDYLSGRRHIPRPPVRGAAPERVITLEGARQNNLKDLRVQFPLGQFTCVTGVSGSGKSSLVLETLYPAMAQKLYRAGIPAGRHDSIQGMAHLDRVLYIDQAPIGRTPRSNPATYTGLFALIREIFARTPEARARGYKPGRFSFNVKGGRCETCRGDGIIKIEMHFLPDMYVTCDACQGRRYNRETLEIKYRGQNIKAVLDMTANQANVFFKRLPKIRTKLETLIDVGVGYVGLGQAATTLSGGESQRIKLARELGRKATGRTVYIMDEPTTGLHFEDINRLLEVLHRLVDGGNTVIVIEHNLDVIKTADHVIDLGPEGGADGGRIVAQGSPEEVAATPGSHTGRFLQKALNRSNE